ncbi:MAG: type III pantothenate kinase [Candidatus Cloacimonetes bacterium]|nr:type III pantothenate kinase [Candidatus Cloacimonadota bacterium]MDD3501339.1 type III pantothenate kinase [Candidatus Cloacimonadota bacterium]
MKYNLVFDIGNTNIVAGVYEGKTLKHTFRFDSDRKKTADEFNSLIFGFANELGISLKDVSKIVACSVVPTLTRTFEQVFFQYFTCPYKFIDGLTPLGITYFTDDPSFIGADLVANAYGVWKKYQSNCIVIDIGTATTIQLVDKNGSYLGVSILPGMKSSATSLFKQASQLFDVKLETPKMLLGNNTQDALLSGLVYGHVFIVDGFVSRIKKEYDNLKDIKVIATGGLASLLNQLTQSIDIMDINLTIDALNLIALL